MTNPDAVALKGNDRLTKRELFAAMAMQGIMGGVPSSSQAAEMVAEWAVDQADALIEALNRLS